MSLPTSGLLRVGVSGDFRMADGAPAFDPTAWQWLREAPNVEIELLDRPAGAPVVGSDVARFDAMLIKRNRVDASVLDATNVPGGRLRLRLLARSGVGYDHIDVEACNSAGVMVCITPEAVARPVASSVLALMLAFSHRLFERDRRTRAGEWARRWDDPGRGLTGRTLGVVGLGNIGREVLRLAAPWKMRHLACTPRPHPALYAGLDVELVAMEALLAQSDVVALCCPLDERTRGMIDAGALARMQPHAILINTARGEVVDEAALVAALRAGQIGGAGIDVFEREPPEKNHPLFALDNVILGSHNLANTDELNAAANRSVARAVLALARGRVPEGLLNPQVLRHARLTALSSQVAER